jgi:hypothetical protein
MMENKKAQKINLWKKIEETETNNITIMEWVTDWLDRLTKDHVRDFLSKIIKNKYFKTRHFDFDFLKKK